MLPLLVSFRLFICPLLLAVVVLAAADQQQSFDREDLKFDGEWWYYSLLASEFPNGTVDGLQRGDVAASWVPGNGDHLFEELPPAEFVLLDLFAPWCPHCQRFSPEMEEVGAVTAQVKDKDGQARVAVLSVDCEKEEVQQVCHWAAVAGLPMLLLARRDVFLAVTNESTVDVIRLPSPTTATQVVTWLSEQVPHWPADFPTPSPIDTASLEALMGPPTGVVEPQEVPAQDLAVAAASLLHEMFAHFEVKTDDDVSSAKAALLDVLALLCVRSPGGRGCQRSACAMREGIESDWDRLTYNQTVQIVDETNTPVERYEALFINWAQVEHEHRWCERPWPEFAMQGWSWCQGRVPGARGYTCGLWLLFHSLLAARPSASETQAPLITIRNFVRHFFTCQECRDHFLALPFDSTEDLSSLRGQSLWLWRAHNNVTSRLCRQRGSSDSDCDEESWPGRDKCLDCRGDDGTWNLQQVYTHVVNFFDCDAIPPDGDPFEMKFETASDPPAILVELYYMATCGMCREFWQSSLLPLIEARLPGSMVQIRMVPSFPPVQSLEVCMNHDQCWYSLWPLCALSSNHLRPVSADSADTLHTGRFLACDVLNTAGGVGRDYDATKRCASQANLNFSELQNCSNSTALVIPLLEDVNMAMLNVQDRLHLAGFQGPPGMPWVFVNGSLLSCTSAECYAFQTPGGDVPLPKAGSLLNVVCSMLANSRPEVCSGDGDASSSDTPEAAEKRGEQACPKCVKDGVDIAAAAAELGRAGAELEVCPGETRRDHLCDHGSYRICLKLLASDGAPLVFGDGLDWWQWSNQTDTRWDQDMRATHGDSWCTCGLCTAEAVDRFGCDRMDFQCNASDAAWIEAAPGVDSVYDGLRDCFRRSCSMPVVDGRIADFRGTRLRLPADARGLGVAGLGTVVAMASFAILAIFRSAYTRRRRIDNRGSHEVMISPLE